MSDFVRPNDLRVNVRLGRILSDQEKYEEGLPYLKKSVEISRESDPDNVGDLLSEVAYSYYKMNDFANAAAVFKERVELLPHETKAAGLRNVIACYQSLQENDSVFKYTNEVLMIEPDDGESLALIGGTWFNKAQEVNSSISAAKKADDAERVKTLEAERTRNYDSVVYFLDKAVKADTTDASSYERLAIAYALQGVPAKATFAWKKLTELSPEVSQNWVNLGDNYISLKEFKNSILPYEKSVELDNTNGAVWRILVDLYQTNGMPDKAKKASARLDELSSK
ncbi:MAG: tetratricopeptide repeat protein [candidate division Zixibacteria bacterium]|nr:tetratricopeptide repeat protein [candidate division Zixibacteria bacterium]